MADILYEIRTKVEPDVGGTVSGGGIYAEDTIATLEAKPNNGYTFDKWSDDCMTAKRTITVTKITAAEEYIAIFHSNEEGDGGGEEQSIGNGILAFKHGAYINNTTTYGFMLLEDCNSEIDGRFKYCIKPTINIVKRHLGKDENLYNVFFVQSNTAINDRATPSDIANMILSNPILIVKNIGEYKDNDSTKESIISALYKLNKDELHKYIKNDDGSIIHPQANGKELNFIEYDDFCINFRYSNKNDFKSELERVLNENMALENYLRTI